MPKCGAYRAKWKANMAKCSKYHAKLQILVPKLLQHERNQTCHKPDKKNMPARDPKQCVGRIRKGKVVDLKSSVAAS